MSTGRSGRIKYSFLIKGDCTRGRCVWSGWIYVKGCLGHLLYLFATYWMYQIKTVWKDMAGAAVVPDLSKGRDNVSWKDKIRSYIFIKYHVGSCDHVMLGHVIMWSKGWQKRISQTRKLLSAVDSWFWICYQHGCWPYCTVRNRMLGFSRFHKKDLHASNKLLQMDKLQSEFHLLFLP